MANSTLGDLWASLRTRRMPCIFKLFLSLLKYVLFGRVFCCLDFTRNIQTNFKNSKRNTIAGSVISGLELGKEGNVAGKRTGKNKTAGFVISSITADYVDDIIKRLIFKKNYCIKQPV